MGRASVDIDEKACAEVMKRYRLKTKSEAINFALRMVAGDTIGDPMTVEEARAMRGFGWYGDLDDMRASRLPCP